MTMVEEIIDVGNETLTYELLNEELIEKINRIYNNYEKDYVLALHKDYVLALHKDFFDYMESSLEDLNKACKVKIDNFLEVFHIKSFIKNGGEIRHLITLLKKHKKVYKQYLINKTFCYDEFTKLIMIIDNFFDEVELLICELWQSIEESDIKFKTLTEITSASVFMHDGECFTYANKATEELTGYTAEELKIKKFWDIVHPDFRELLKNNGQVRKTGEVLEPSRYEVKIITKQGKEKWIDINVGSIMLYRKRMILGIGSNISIGKKMQEELAASEEQMRTLINSMSDLVCFKDEKGRWLEANNFTINLFELDKNNYKGKKESEFGIKDNFYDESFKACQKSDREAIEAKKIIHCEEYVPQRDGTCKIFDVVKVPLYHEDGSNRGITVLGRDISERKRTEELTKEVEEHTRLLNEAMAYDKLKTEFFANISHELRTPLNVILSTMQLFDLIVNEDSIVENENKIKRYINMTKQNCNRLLRLVNNLIDITKIDAGFFQLNYQNEDIVRIVEDITLSVAEYIENKGITLQFDTDVEEKVIGCDSQIIERIILNLLSNAVKFTEVDGNIGVNIHDKGETVLISVKDTGIGIHEEKQNLIFERFVQVDKSLSRNQEGSGIGLSLVKSLVEMHNGRIWVMSKYGKGSEFIVELPAKRLEQENLDSSVFSIITNKERVNVEFSDIYM